MIHDGFWNNDLTQLASEISFWYKKINELFSQNYHYGDSEVDTFNLETDKRRRLCSRE